MKIVFVNRFYAPDHSATSQMLTDLAIALAAGGAEVQVVTSRLRYDDAAASLAPHELIDGVEVHRVWTSRFGRGNLAGRALDYLSFYVAAGAKLFGLVAVGRCRRRQDRSAARIGGRRLGRAAARSAARELAAGPPSRGGRESRHGAGARPRRIAAALVARRLAAPRRGQRRARAADARVCDGAGRRSDRGSR